MSKQETQILKGVAILMMVWLHLFNKGDVGILGNLIVVDGRPLVAWIARACNPVSMFVALGGYGLYFTYQRGNDRHHYSRVLKLYVHYWIILAIFVPLCCIVRRDWSYIGTPWNVLGNLTGYNITWNFECWFLLPYSLLSLAYPWVFRVMDRLRPLTVIATTFVLGLGAMTLMHFGLFGGYPLLSLLITLVSFLFCFTAGALACKYDVVTKAKTWAAGLKTHRGGQVLLWLSLLLLFVVRCLVPHASWGGIFALLFLLNVLLLKRNSKVDQGLVFLGNHSMNIWMIHTWFCTYIFHAQLWVLHYPLLIYLTVLAISLLCSYIVDNIISLREVNS